jgi:two-component system, response regulator / RNA-binding antiterminator
MFTDDDDTSHVRDVLAAGVSAYVVAGLAPDRIRPVLEVALARFQHEHNFVANWPMRAPSQERKVIEREGAVPLLPVRNQLGLSV